MIKVISEGGFSSLGFILFVADHTVINHLAASTLRIGRKHLQILDALHDQNRIFDAEFIIGSIMKNDSELVKGYGYYDDLEKVCESNGWTIKLKNNHSKIILFDTDIGKFVLETSSNLNENPKMEQFSFEKSSELYDFYKKTLLE